MQNPSSQDQISTEQISTDQTNAEQINHHDLQQLADKISAGAELSADERLLASTLLRFHQVIEGAVKVAARYGSVAMMTAYPAGSREVEDQQKGADPGAVPLMYVIACHEPDAETWQRLNAVLDEHEADQEDGG